MGWLGGREERLKETPGTCPWAGGQAGRPGTWAQTFFHLTDAFLPWRTVNCRSRREEESWEEERRLALEDSFWPFYRWCYKKQVLVLEKEGLWPEPLDSGKIEICVSAW